MKTIEALNLLDAFNRVLSDSTLTNDEKVSIGKELLRQLPHEDLFVSSGETLKAVRRSIKDRTEALEPKESVARRTEPQGSPAKGTAGRKSKEKD